MKYQAVLSSKAHPEYGQATIPFPIPDSEYDRTIGLLEDMGIGSPIDQDCRVDGIDSSYPVLNRLVTQSVNVDELDYLAKRLDSFCQGENEKFQAMASKLDLIQSGAGVVTPYGVVYDNGMELEQVYDGRHYPEYCHKLPLMELEISSVPGGAAAGYLYLPCPDKQIQRTLMRTGQDLENFRWEVTMDELPPHVSEVVSPTRDSLDSLNALCRVIEPLSAEQREKLAAVVLMTKPECASEVRQLAENLDQFDFVPKPDSQVVDSVLTELGYVSYHGSLTLDELMADDPAELYQREQEMGGMA